MWLRWLADPWTLRSDIAGDIGFCVWILQIDGLRVAPFAHHPEGSGHLRALGMTATDWRAWYMGVLGGSPPRRPARPSQTVVAIHSGLPYRTWAGPGAVGTALTELWPRYQRERDVWRQQILRPHGALWHTPREGRRWWRQLRAAGRALPPVTAHLINYPEPLLAAHPPTALVVAAPFATLDWATYAGRVIEGVRQLGAATGGHGDIPG